MMLETTARPNLIVNTITSKIDNVKCRVRSFAKKADEFIKDETGQDFAEYALILGAVAAVALVVLAAFKTELIAAFNAGIQALRAARS